MQLGGHELQANPAYRFHGADEFTPAQREMLTTLLDRRTVAGILVAEAGSGLPGKVVGPAGALLFGALGGVPGQADHARVGLPDAELAELVLDGVLGMRCDEAFLSGPAAYPCLFGELPELPVALDAPGRLSLAALSYASRLPGLGPTSRPRLPGRTDLTGVEPLTARLYGYHRLPVSPSWQRAYPGPPAVLGLLAGLDLGRTWTGPLDPSPRAPWLTWRRRDDPSPYRPGDLPYKLYLSPHVDDVPHVVPEAIDCLGELDVPRFKIGADAAGLLRPDKFVAYFRDVRSLEDAAAELARRFAGVPAHGVPFSAGLTGPQSEPGDGLLSWGGDPPAGEAPVGAGTESWRLSVCRRLAENLVTARAAGLGGDQPVRYALARLASAGVTVPQFAPAALAAPRLPRPAPSGGR